MSILLILDKDGKKTGSVDLPEEIFEGRSNPDVIHQAVVMYHASKRQGNASTKERGSVRGGGRKPYRQKGTGRARQGSIRSPLWKGGGVVFGPHPRDFGYTVPKKIRNAALRESLKAKYKDENLVCVDDLKEPLNKTKDFAQILRNLSLKGKVLALLDGSDASIERVSRNIGTVNVMRAQDVTAYDLLKHKKVLVSKTGFNNLLERIKK